MVSIRLSKKEYFLEMLSLVSARSTCHRRSVGAIITDYDGHILSTGYNGVPRGMPHCLEFHCPGASDVSGDNSRCLAVHAEQNAILHCADIHRAHTIYVSCAPCFSCSKLIANTPITNIICAKDYPDHLGLNLLLHLGKVIEIEGAEILEETSR